MEVAHEPQVKRPPRRDQVHGWVAQAKEMERAVFYS